MGMIEMKDAIEPVNGKYVSRWQRYETIPCKHCQSVIAILVQGCSRDYQSQFTCVRCHGSICKHCAKIMHANRGVCPGPFVAKIEAAFKHSDGNWLRRSFIHKYRT